MAIQHEVVEADIGPPQSRVVGGHRPEHRPRLPHETLAAAVLLLTRPFSAEVDLRVLGTGGGDEVTTYRHRGQGAGQWPRASPLRHPPASSPPPRFSCAPPRSWPSCRPLARGSGAS